MSPFGPYYPLVLASVMRHAERLTELLSLRERFAPPGDGSRAWVVGRAAELRCVAGVIARDWHDGKLSAEAAALRLRQHLGHLHEGLARHLGLHWPPCCRPDAGRSGAASAPAVCRLDGRGTS